MTSSTRAIDLILKGSGSLRAEQCPGDEQLTEYWKNPFFAQAKCIYSLAYGWSPNSAIFISERFTVFAGFRFFTRQYQD